MLPFGVAHNLFQESFLHQQKQISGIQLSEQTVRLFVLSTKYPTHVTS